MSAEEEQLSWQFTDRPEMAKVGYTFNLAFFVTLAVLVVPVIILPILLYVFDTLTFKKYVGANVISVDPKGFSTNDLFLLNTKQCADGCQMNNVEVKDQGCLNVLSTANIILPIISPKEEVHCTAENLFIVSAQPNATKQDSLKILQIQEYHDVTGLSDANEIN